MSSSGKPFTSVGIKVDGKWMSGFGGKWNQYWKQGDTVEVEVVKKGEYLNFECPEHLKPKRSNFNKANDDLIQSLIKRVENLEKILLKDDLPNLDDIQF